MGKGVFISFEGGEAVGKSTQIALLASALKKEGYPIHISREPGGTKLGEKLRTIIKSDPMCSRAELLLFQASRAELVESVLVPKLKKGVIVISDRYAESSLVYQGMTRKLPLREVAAANQIATGGLRSDFIVLLHGKTAQARMNRRGSKDRIEREKNDFHRQVAQNYLKLARSDKRFHIYPADLDRQQIHKMILKDILKLINRKMS